MNNREYQRTKDISILSIIVIRFIRVIEVISSVIVKPKYILNDSNVVLEVDYKSSTIKRIYPNPLNETAKVKDASDYLFGYWNEFYYSKEKAIKESSKYYTIDGKKRN